MFRMNSNAIRGHRQIGMRSRLSPSALGAVKLNSSSAQASGLVGWWPTRDYVGGNLLDRSGNGNDGTLYGSVGTYDHPDIGRMVRFAGVENQYFSVANAAAINITGSMSVSFWMIPRWPVLAQYYGILGKGTESPRSLCQFMFYHVDTYETDHCIDWHVGIGTDAFVVAEAKPFTIGGVYHVVGVHDATGEDMITYLNVTDTETWTGTASALEVQDAPLTIGFTDTSGGVWAYCDLADIRIYNKALSAEEIGAIYAPATRWELYL